LNRQHHLTQPAPDTGHECLCFKAALGYKIGMENEPTQLDRFKEAARQLETDDDEARFDAKLKKVAKASKPKDDENKK
jgi:hypothetical protein